MKPNVPIGTEKLGTIIPLTRRQICQYVLKILKFMHVDSVITLPRAYS